MKFVSDILARAGLTVNGVVTFNNTATGQTPASNDDSTKLSTTEWVRAYVAGATSNYVLPTASETVLGGIKIGLGLSIDGNGVVSVTGGGLTGTASIRTENTQTATAGQTVFTIPGGYTPGLIDVYINGSHLTGSNFTATNGTTVALADAAAAGDIVDFIVYSGIYSGSLVTTDQLAEGTTNLYFTTARARAALSGATGRISYSSSTGVIDLATSGATAGSYGSSSAIPTITVDEYGRITSISTTAVSIITTLAGLSDVTLTSPSNGQLLNYNSSTSKWENFTPTYISGITGSDVNTALGYTAANDGAVVHIAGTETITGVKTFEQNLTIGTSSVTGLLKLQAAGGESASITKATGGGLNFTIVAGANRLVTFGSGTDGLYIDNGVGNITLNYSGSGGRSFIARINNAVTSNGPQIEMFQTNAYATINAGKFGGTGIATTLALAIDGSQKVFVFTDGNTSIGNATNAGYKIDVSGTSRFTGAMLINPTFVASANILTVGVATASQFRVTYGSTSDHISVNIGNALSINRAGGGVPSIISTLGLNFFGGVFSVNGAFNGSVYAPGELRLSGNYSAGSAAFGAYNTANSSLIFGNSYNSYSAVQNVYARNTNWHQNDSTTSAPTFVASAIMSLSSTTKGFLPPRMTQAEREAITSPATGLVVYQTDGTEGLYIKLASGWKGLVVA